MVFSPPPLMFEVTFTLLPLIPSTVSLTLALGLEATNSSKPRNSNSLGFTPLLGAPSDLAHSVICLPFRLAGAFVIKASIVGEVKPRSSLANVSMSACNILFVSSSAVMPLPPLPALLPVAAALATVPKAPKPFKPVPIVAPRKVPATGAA